MTTQTLTLTEFLDARITEDEVNATLRQWHHETCESVPQLGDEYTYPCECGVPERMKRECEAKRRIVELHRDWLVLGEGPMEFESVDPTDVSSMTFRASRQILWATEQEYRQRFGGEPPTGPILLAMAQVYADHPDFDEAWRA